MRVAILSWPLLAAGPLAAQTPPAPPTPAPAVWTVGGELALTELSGNKSLTLFTSGLTLKRVAPDGATADALVAMRYGTSNGAVATENYRAELGARLAPQGRVSPALRLTAARDPQKSLDLRLAISAGLTVALAANGPEELQLGIALLQDREYRSLPAGSDLAERVSFTRFDLRFRGRIPVREAVTVEHLTVMQPVAGDLQDYLLTSRSALQVFLTRQLALQTSYLVERDATPLPSVPFKDDRTLTLGILLRFTSGG